MKVKVRDIISYLDSEIPADYQESYDNSGLQVGNPDAIIEAALLSLDITEEVIREACETGAGLVITHHPLIFKPLKRIAMGSDVERVISTAIKNNISVYSAHTNLDVHENGVSRKLADVIGLESLSPLVPLKGKLMKLVTFIPLENVDQVSKAVFNAGAGVTGNYDNCSFRVEGTGSFRGNEDSNPYKGVKGDVHSEPEIRFETVLFARDSRRVVKALLEAHPYEEVAYDLIALENEYNGAGMGITGNLAEPMKESEFLKMIALKLESKGLRYSQPTGKDIRRVAVIGGAGASLLRDALAVGADALITGDVKYHDFLEAAGRILLVDAGHFETEKYSTEILYDLIIKKFPTFALRFSGKNKNPINYL
ncbi:MAG: Nif3-like dinuclear metal center hexameric protein [Bacteroidales bacterium]